jgi:hypothetical protein
MNLYEISNDYKNVFSELERIGFDEETIKDTLAEKKDDLQVKCQSVAFYIANIEAEQKAVKEAAAKMADRAKVIQNKIDGMKAYLLENMLLNDITEISSPELVIKTAKTPAKVIIDGDIPDDFLIRRVTDAPDKKAIKLAIDNGETVKGAHLETGFRLSIK